MGWKIGSQFGPQTYAARWAKGGGGRRVAQQDKQRGRDGELQKKQMQDIPVKVIDLRPDGWSKT